MSRLPSVLPLLVLGASVVASAACSDDEGSSGPAGPAGPPSLRIASLRPAGGPVVSVPPASEPEALCLEAGRDPGRTVDVVLAPVPNFTFAPPSSCWDTPQCGYVLLTVSAPGAAPRKLVMVGPALSVPLAELGFEPGSPLTFHVELLLAGTNSVLLSPDGGTFSDELTVRFVARCQPDGGTGDGGTGDGGDGSIEDAAPHDAGDGGTGDGGDGSIEDAAPHDAGDASSQDAADAGLDSSAPGDAAPGDAAPADGAAEAGGPDGAPRDATSG